MFRKILLAAAVVAATTLAMSPQDAEARWGYRRAWRAPARMSVGYGPRYAPRRAYVPRYYGNRLYYSAPTRGYYYRGSGVGLTVGPGARSYYGW
ncbi:hypothetical protein NG895_14165 [Aeoliella sp. ICT_H6.2]|uniref:YXWGXW repeat-containing protein n=1 Tax=Aeoliella straminimaris TaxID=2954799 RepID=A0A9X2FG34_9BACT|nr:hypothetical protein [Aeoliella straminimaris]MCO6045051.1 hypothetical protein [Aeoliella straminimaris]